MSVATRPQQRLRRRRRVRAKVQGTSERPRLSVFRSNRRVSAQLIDDVAAVTIEAVNWTEPDLKSLGRMDQAKRVGVLLAQRVKEVGVDSCVLDRGGYTYHVRVDAIAHSSRECDLGYCFRYPPLFVITNLPRQRR